MNSRLYMSSNYHLVERIDTVDIDDSDISFDMASKAWRVNFIYVMAQHWFM